MTTVADPIQLIEHLTDMASVEREALQIAIEYINTTAQWGLGLPYSHEAAVTLERISAKLAQIKRIQV